MRFLVFSIFILTIILSCSKLDSTGKIDIEIKNHTLAIHLDMTNRIIHIEDQISFQTGAPTKYLHFLMNKSAKIEQISLNDIEVNFKLNHDISKGKYFTEEDLTEENRLQDVAELGIYLDKKIENGILYLKYQLNPRDSIDKAAFSREYIAYEVKDYIGSQGIFISPSSYWYADLPSNLATFQVKISCPDSIHIITQGNLVHNSVKDAIRHLEWQINYPANGLHLVGSKYIVNKSKYKDIDILTYFFPNTTGLAPSYLAACERYLAMYEELIGPYPFKKFAVVENFFPTGYGMPSYTLLGSQVIRLPFIISTSLGHEIAHNWWGNSVYVDYKNGNWCEGLTTYFADYLYKEQKNPEEASSYRRDINRDFTVYVKDSKDIALSDFTERTESASRAIGYGKSAMVFHQLRKLVGDSLFWASFKDFYNNNMFQKASWSDIQASVQRVSGQDYNWFFEQWIQRKGAPSVGFYGKRYESSILLIELEQTEPLFNIHVPITIHTHNGDVERTVELHKKRQEYMFLMKWVPRSMTIDPHFDVFRKLNKKEIPPTLSEIFAQDSIILILPDRCDNERLEKYKEFVDMFVENEKKYKVTSPDLISPSNAHTLILLGNPRENSFFDNVTFSIQSEVEFTQNQILLNGEVRPADPDLLVLALRDKNNENRNLGVIAIGQNGEIGRAGSLIKHYGKYSYLVFTGGKNSVKDIYSVLDNPLSITF